MSNEIRNHKIIILKNFCKRNLIVNIKKYLSNIGRNSLPKYNPIEFGTDNFHRICNNDERSFIKGTFHQFSFFPWNQDIFNLFSEFSNIYLIKNYLDNNQYLNSKWYCKKKKLVNRIAFQFYPAKIGYLEKHSDPKGLHQEFLPLLTLSKKKIDFNYGGLYVDIDGKNIDIDINTNIGDFVFFDPSIPHEVKSINPKSNNKWFDFVGRWSGVFSTNKFNSNTNIKTKLNFLNIFNIKK